MKTDTVTMSKQVGFPFREGGLSANEWIVRRYEIPFDVNSFFVAELNSHLHSSPVEVRIGNRKSVIQFAIVSSYPFWKEIEQELDSLIEQVQSARRQKELLGMLQAPKEDEDSDDFVSD